jgi:hypothetical protein
MRAQRDVFFDDVFDQNREHQIGGAKGIMLTYQPGENIPTVMELTEPPAAELIHYAIGGRMELVPHFDSIRWNGKSRSCAAFCNEEGKLQQLPINIHATMLWWMSCKTKPDNVLAGPVAVIFGDEEFMTNLNTHAH